MSDRHVKGWNLKEPQAPVFEDGCGCVSMTAQYTKKQGKEMKEKKDE